MTGPHRCTERGSQASKASHRHCLPQRGTNGDRIADDHEANGRIEAPPELVTAAGHGVERWSR